MSEPELESARARGGYDSLAAKLAEMEAAIAESQAALLAGRLCDLEASSQKQQELFATLRDLISAPVEASDGVRARVLSPKVMAAVRQVHAGNLVLAGVLRRMRRNLDGLRRQIHGSEPSYTYGRESNSAPAVNSQSLGGSGV
jgi:hypothetical protein